MDVRLAVAGFLCLALAAGHGTIGLVWVLPRLREAQLPATPLGPPPATLSLLRVTWHVVTIFALALGGLLVSLAWARGVDPETLMLRWFAAMWLAATVMAFRVAPLRRQSLRKRLQLPVPFVWLVVAALCWTAST